MQVSVETRKRFCVLGDHRNTRFWNSPCGTSLFHIYATLHWELEEKRCQNMETPCATCCHPTKASSHSHCSRFLLLSIQSIGRVVAKDFRCSQLARDFGHKPMLRLCGSALPRRPPPPEYRVLGLHLNARHCCNSANSVLAFVFKPTPYLIPSSLPPFLIEFLLLPCCEYIQLLFCLVH